MSLASVSLLCSVLSRKTRDALGLAYGIGFAYLIVSGVAYGDAAAGRAPLPPRWADAYARVAGAFAAGNPAVLVERVGTLSGRPAAAEGLRYAAFHLAVAVAAFALAAARLRAAARAAHSPLRSRLLRWASGERKAARPHPPVGDDPMFWKEVHVEPWAGRRLVGRAANLLVVGLTAWGLAGAAWEAAHVPPGSKPHVWRQPINGWVMAVSAGLGFVVCLRAAIHGAGAVTREREQDTATALRTTDLTAWEMLRGKFWGCVLAQRTALYVLAAAWLVGVLTGAASVFGLLAFCGVFPLYAAVFAWIGLACSARSRTTIQATIAAVVGVGLASGGMVVLTACCCCGVGGMLVQGSGRLPDGLAVFLGSYVVCLCPSAVLAGIAVEPSDLKAYFAQESFLHGLPGMAFGDAAALGTWAGLGVWLYRATREKFRALTNREE